MSMENGLRGGRKGRGIRTGVNMVKRKTQRRNSVSLMKSRKNWWKVKRRTSMTLIGEIFQIQVSIIVNDE